MLDKVSKVGNKRVNVMVRFTKVCRFNQKQKKINVELLSQKKYWKEECKQQREKTVESNEKMRILTDLGMHVLQDMM